MDSRQGPGSKLGVRVHRLHVGWPGRELRKGVGWGREVGHKAERIDSPDPGTGER